MGTNERVHFRLIQCPECHTLLCCVNPRYYNYCPECGKYIYPHIKGCVLVSDDDAQLSWKDNG